MRKFVILAVAVLSLGGCAAAIQRAEVNTCKNWGFYPGTDQFLSCMEGQQASRAASERVNSALMMYGAAMMTGLPATTYIAP